METTGFHNSDRIWAIGVVRVRDAQPASTHTWLVNIFDGLTRADAHEYEQRLADSQQTYGTRHHADVVTPSRLYRDGLSPSQAFREFHDFLLPRLQAGWWLAGANCSKFDTRMLAGAFREHLPTVDPTLLTNTAVLDTVALTWAARRSPPFPDDRAGLMEWSRHVGPAKSVRCRAEDFQSLLLDAGRLTAPLNLHVDPAQDCLLVHHVLEAWRAELLQLGVREAEEAHGQEARKAD